MDFYIYPDNQFKYFSTPYVPYWVRTDVFERLWSLDTDGYYHPGEENYFSGNQARMDSIDAGKKLVGEWIFKCGRAYLGIKNGVFCLHFNNGRHRTRWLIDRQGFTEKLPLALSGDSIPKAEAEGLLISPIKEFEIIKLNTSVEEILTEREEFENLCNF